MTDELNAKDLAVVYIADADFAANTCVSIHSLSASSRRPLEIFLLCYKLPRALKHAAEQSLSGLPDKIRLIEMDEVDFDDTPAPLSLPRSSYGCLMIDGYIPSAYERVLYLDGDTLVHLDITPLARLDMQGRRFAAVLDFARVTSGKASGDARRLNFVPRGQYFNSGVLLLDYKRWRDEGTGRRCLGALVATPERYEQGDQCVLNESCRGFWLPLQAKWNYQAELINFFPNSNSIQHFLGKHKPWSTKTTRYRIQATRHYQKFFSCSPLPAPPHLYARPNALVAMGALLRLLKPELIQRRRRLGKLVKHYDRAAVI